MKDICSICTKKECTSCQCNTCEKECIGCSTYNQEVDSHTEWSADYKEYLKSIFDPRD